MRDRMDNGSLPSQIDWEAFHASFNLYTRVLADPDKFLERVQFHIDAMKLWEGAEI